MHYRNGEISELNEIKQLAMAAWGKFQSQLTPENWNKLIGGLEDDRTYIDLFNSADCVVCTTDENQLIGMAFLVSSGHPTEIYLSEWSYIRFVSVHPSYARKGIGRKLTEICINRAKANQEKHIALHTSELMRNAIHIYESLGFTVVSEIPPRLGKKYWLYKLDL
ncbi:MAG: GNAT family N-acetyltransferase [Crocinitomix sp.]|nr:GNAT family N-acetyltransferase [Crocinitomix sp.]